MDLIIPTLCLLVESEGDKVKVLNNEVSACTSKPCESTAEVTDGSNHPVSGILFYFCLYDVSDIIQTEENCIIRRVALRKRSQNSWCQRW